MGTIRRFPQKKCYLPCLDVKSGIKTDKIHFLPFKLNKTMQMVGFGMYGPTTARELKIQYGILLDDFCNVGNHKTVLSKNKKVINFNGHRNVVPLMFSEPIEIRKYETYVLFLNTDGYKTYRGYDGSRIVGAGRVRLSFGSDFEEVSETSVVEGNFPELYFKNCEAPAKPQETDEAKVDDQIRTKVEIKNM